jgi:hypothetical protein
VVLSERDVESLPSHSISLRLRALSPLMGENPIGDCIEPRKRPSPWGTDLSSSTPPERSRPPHRLPATRAYVERNRHAGACRNGGTTRRISLPGPT